MAESSTKFPDASDPISVVCSPLVVLVVDCGGLVTELPGIMSFPRGTILVSGTSLPDQIGGGNKILVGVRVFASTTTSDVAEGPPLWPFGEDMGRKCHQNWWETRSYPLQRAWGETAGTSKQRCVSLWPLPIAGDA